METFTERIRSSVIPAEVVDDFADAWHQSNSSDSLPDFLDMTPADYEAWLKNPDVLRTSVSPSTGI